MTNIRLDPALWARVKAAAGERGTTLERWVSEALERHLARGAQPARADGTPGPGPSRHAQPQDGAPPADALQALHWRVEALEQAVDFLANEVGAGFARGGAPPAGGPEGRGGRG